MIDAERGRIRRLAGRTLPGRHRFGPDAARGAILFTAMLMALASPAIADLWYEHYEKGEAALNSQRWEDAVREFNEAIKKRGEPGAAARTYGMNFIKYHPYLKMGIAYLNMGRLEEALQAFDAEEKFGAITRSNAEMKNLQSFRRLAQDAIQARRVPERDRIAAVVSESLREASALERGGLLDESMAALGRGLAVDPNQPELRSSMRRVRDRAAAEAQVRDRRTKTDTALSKATDLMARGSYQEAAKVLEQASLLDPANQEVEDLLEECRHRLPPPAGAAAPPGQRDTMVADSLAISARYEQEGRLASALDAVQYVLGVEPDNPEALNRRSRILKLQSEEEGLAARRSLAQGLLDEAVNHLKSGRHAQSVAGFSKVVALDPDNVAARAYLREAFVAMNQRILSGEGAPAAPKIPPVIALANTAGEVDEAQRPEERVSSAVFAIHGIFISDQPHVLATFVRGIPADGDAQEAAEEVIARIPDLTPEPMGGLYQFRFRQLVALQPGLTLLKLRVEDPRGISREQEHRVRYVRPFTRSPWFYSTLALLALTAAGSAQGYRAYRRRKLSERRFNPYVAGAPVLGDDLFVGREALLSRILMSIHNNSILLYGERRIGKTTLQHHLKRRLQQVRDPEFDFYPVFVDLQGTPQERFFRTLAEDIFEELSPILDGAQPVGRPEPGQEYTYESFVRGIHGILKLLKKRSSRRVRLVLLIDEVDELNAYDPRINQKLRSLFMKSFAEDLVAVVSGVGIKKHWASEGSPWYNFFEELEVKPFAREDARKLVEDPIRGVFKLDEAALERIIDESGCRPYLIQKTCIALVNRMHDAGRRRITVADVEAVGRPMET